MQLIHTRTHIAQTHWTGIHGHTQHVHRPFDWCAAHWTPFSFIIHERFNCIKCNIYCLFKKAIPNWQISYHNFFADKLMIGGVTGVTGVAASAACTAATIRRVVVVDICYRICDNVTVDITTGLFVIWKARWTVIDWCRGGCGNGGLISQPKWITQIDFRIPTEYKRRWYCTDNRWRTTMATIAQWDCSCLIVYGCCCCCCCRCCLSLVNLDIGCVLVMMIVITDILGIGCGQRCWYEMWWMLETGYGIIWMLDEIGIKIGGR